MNKTLPLWFALCQLSLLLGAYDSRGKWDKFYKIYSECTNIVQQWALSSKSHQHFFKERKQHILPKYSDLFGSKNLEISAPYL